MSQPLDKKFELRKVRRDAAATHDYIHDQGFLCHGCTHRHAGAVEAYICRGCRCERRAPTLQDFEFARSVNWAITVTYADFTITSPLSDAGDQRRPH